MRHWHPLFAQLLRPLVERYYDMQTTVPVGDVPREADLVLLRRTAARPPFRGLWKNLTTWNVLEFKGPTVSPRVRHLDLLVELGLGIDRRLNEERTQQKQKLLAPEEVSLWYLTNKLGRRFLGEARRRFGSVAEHGAGVWRSTLLRRPVFLVSSIALPVEEDSVPLHLISREPPETAVAVARLVMERPTLWDMYNEWLQTLHPAAWKEVGGMARGTRGGFQIDLRPLIEAVGLKQVIETVGVKQAVEAVGLKRVIDEVGVDDLIAHLTPAQRAELKRKLR